MSHTTSTYDPARLLDGLSARLGLASDGQLSRELGVSPSLICRIRQGKHVTSNTLLLMHEASGISIRELRNMMGDTSPGYWTGVPAEKKRALGRAMPRRPRTATMAIGSAA